MKVTVCFGEVRVIVPCGNGDLVVSELITKAISRYKKATGKPNDFYVNVHSLKSFSDGGILDHDDILSDVADDREQIIALYEEQGGPIPHNGGDGTSASSVGTASPDIFQGHDRDHKGFQPVIKQDNNRNDVVVTSDDLNAPSSLTVLQVRRGSEPSLTEIGKDSPPSKPEPTVPHPNKRWPGVTAVEDPKPMQIGKKSKSPEDKPRLKEFERVIDADDEGSFVRLGRDSVHRSLTGSNMYNWLQAQAKTEQKYTEMNRKEPLGGSGLAHEDEKENKTPGKEAEDVWSITLKKEAGPLGIHVVPYYDSNGRDSGLLIQGIEPGGRIKRDGRFHPQDRIIEINGQSLMEVNFNHAQEIFRDALQTDELSLKVVKTEGDNAKKPPAPSKKPPPVLPKPVMPKTDQNKASEQINNKDETSLITEKPPSPNKKVPPAPPTRDPNTQLSTPVKITAPTNTRRLGKLVHIQLTKGPQGLGFSITTRDNPASTDCPIYIKNILPKGAAITDGRLKSGDRLLEVNGIEMTGKSQAEAVAILRNTKLGSVVNLVVSRQETASSQFAVPREMPSYFQPAEKAGDDATLATPANKEVLTFNIPLNETGSAGLGVSVKGKTRTTPHGTQDLGIFIKGVISGGAASKDGRLNINDQLIQVNSESLLGKTNSEAMERLRNSMQVEGPMPGYINLVVARKLGPATPSRTPEPQGVEILDQTVMSEYFGQTHYDSASSEESNTEEARNAKNSMYHNAPSDLDTQKIRNPILDQLTSDRNDSYQYATKENFTPGQSSNQGQRSIQEYADGYNTLPSMKGAKQQNTQVPYGNSVTYSSPTLNIGSDNTVMIDDEAIPARRTSSSQRPHSVHGSLHPSTNQDDTRSSSSRSNEEQDISAPKPPSWLVEWDKTQENGDSEEGDEGNFKREGFGRQSFSEKRRHLDKDRNEEIVLQAKKVRDEMQGRISPRPGHLVRVGSAESLVGHSMFDTKHAKTEEVGPTLGMKKSSSLESLQTMVQEVVAEEDKNPYKPPNRVARGRGCNESFRTAVDRSYEAPHMEMTMEALEEESSESGHGQSSRQSSFSNGSISEDPSRKGNKKKKKSGIFGGFGNMFKFGKHRKPLEDRAPKPAKDIHLQDVEKQRTEQLEKLQARKAAQEEQERIQEQYKKLQEKQRQMDSQQPVQPRVPPDYSNYGNYSQLPPKQYPPQQQQYHSHGNYEQQRIYEQQRRYDQQRNYEEQRHYDRLRNFEQQRQYEPSNHGNRDYEQYGSYGLEPPQSRAERIQQLRSEHQKRHRERQGQYPGEDREEHYEQVVQREVAQRPPKTHRYSGGDYETQVPLRPKRETYERATISRISYPASHEHYSHYQNAAEIKDAMQRHDAYQDRYYQKQQQQQRFDQYDRPLPREPQYHREPVYSESDNRGRSNTPSNQMGYLSHHNKKQSNAAVTSSSYASDIKPGHAGDYNDYDDPRNAYTDNSLYAKVQKRTKGQGVNGPAQV